MVIYEYLIVVSGIRGWEELAYNRKLYVYLVRVFVFAEGRHVLYYFSVVFIFMVVHIRLAQARRLVIVLYEVG